MWTWNQAINAPNPWNEINTQVQWEKRGRGWSARVSKRIMQSNIGNERFSHPGPKAQALPGNNRNIIDLVPRQNWGPNSQGSWEQMQKHALIPRLYLGPNPQGLWEQTTTSTITPGAQKLTMWVYGEKGDVYGALHPLPWLIDLKKIKLRKIITKLLGLYANSTQMDKIVKMSK